MFSGDEHGLSGSGGPQPKPEQPMNWAQVAGLLVVALFILALVYILRTT